MKNRFLNSTFVGLLLLTVPALATEISESRTIEETLGFDGSGGKRLIVDNVFGSVSIQSQKGNSIVMAVQETRYARTVEGIARSKQEVDLKIYRRDGEIELFVDGPFRHSDDRHCWSHFRDHRPTYRVQYDFEILVPDSTDLDVRTINDGDIKITDVRGNFHISNVNGSVRLEGLDGSGEVETVNGEIWASFTGNPTADTRFVTVNGEVEARFQSDLSADLELKARWGEVWSEYSVEPLPSSPPTQRTDNGRTVIEFDSSSRVRVGDGGPTLYFETLNGDIFVRRNTG